MYIIHCRAFYESTFVQNRYQNGMFEIRLNPLNPYEIRDIVCLFHNSFFFLFGVLFSACLPREFRNALNDWTVKSRRKKKKNKERKRNKSVRCSNNDNVSNAIRNIPCLIASLPSCFTTRLNGLIKIQVYSIFIKMSNVKHCYCKWKCTIFYGFVILEANDKMVEWWIVTENGFFQFYYVELQSFIDLLKLIFIWGEQKKEIRNYRLALQWPDHH